MAALLFKGQLTSLQVIEVHDQIILIDCGEGAQMFLSKYKIPLSKCQVICISHLHGDHVYGLPGLLSSLEHGQRKTGITIIGPEGIEDYVRSIQRLSFQHLSYPIEFVECTNTEKEVIFSSASFYIHAFPLQHRVPTYGYIFEEKKSWKNLDKEAISKYGLTIDEIKLARTGKDIPRANMIIPNKEVTREEVSPKSYAYCSDTMFDPSVATCVQGVDVLYHEATYTRDLESKAVERKHSTAEQAATIAKLAGVKQLILGHFSARYQDLGVLELEAKEIFPNVILGIEGTIIDINESRDLTKI